MATRTIPFADEKMYCFVLLEKFLVLNNASAAVLPISSVVSILCLRSVCVYGRLGVQELGYLVVSHCSSDSRTRNNVPGLFIISRE